MQPRLAYRQRGGAMVVRRPGRVAHPRRRAVLTSGWLAGRRAYRLRVLCHTGTRVWLVLLKKAPRYSILKHSEHWMPQSPEVFPVSLFLVLLFLLPPNTQKKEKKKGRHAKKRQHSFMVLCHVPSSSICACSPPAARPTEKRYNVCNTMTFFTRCHFPHVHNFRI
jgi:hypothetical protein